MCWLLLLLFLWVSWVAWSYAIFYYESANDSHLEILRSRGSVAVLLMKGFFWSLLSHFLMLVTSITSIHKNFWRLSSGLASQPPVIFVHGLYHDRTAWYLYLRWFRRWGWKHLKAVNLRGKFRSIPDYAQMLAEEIENTLAETGSEQVDLVGHSMGGLVIRSYLAGDGARRKVRKVVTLGSPHAGSKLAAFGVGWASKEMLPGSHFLESLREQENKLPDKRLICAIYTILDNMVLPNRSAKLAGDGAKVVETRPINHIGLLFCKRTAQLVKECLEEDT